MSFSDATHGLVFDASELTSHRRSGIEDCLTAELTINLGMLRSSTLEKAYCASLRGTSPFRPRLSIHHLPPRRLLHTLIFSLRYLCQPRQKIYRRLHASQAISRVRAWCWLTSCRSATICAKGFDLTAMANFCLNSQPDGPELQPSRSRLGRGVKIPGIPL